LNKVKRTVIRNGKEMQMTVYEDGNKDNDSNEKQEGKEEVSRSAVGARAISNGEEGKVNPKKVANSLSSLSKKGVDVSHVNTNSSLYKEFVDDNGDTLGITSFKRTENDIILDSYASSPDSDGVGARAIMELLRLSIKENKNAVVYDIELPEAIEYLKTLGFKPNKDGYILRKKDVKQFLGDYSDLFSTIIIYSIVFILYIIIKLYYIKSNMSRIDNTTELLKVLQEDIEGKIKKEGRDK